MHSAEGQFQSIVPLLENISKITTPKLNTTLLEVKYRSDTKENTT